MQEVIQKTTSYCTIKSSFEPTAKKARDQLTHWWISQCCNPGVSNWQTLLTDPLELKMQENTQSWVMWTQTKTKTQHHHLLVYHHHLGFVWKKEAVRLSQFLFGPPVLLHLSPLFDELAHKVSRRVVSSEKQMWHSGQNLTTFYAHHSGGICEFKCIDQPPSLAARCVWAWLCST